LLNRLKQRSDKIKEKCEEEVTKKAYGAGRKVLKIKE
jgi:hypothetical protein